MCNEKGCKCGCCAAHGRKKAGKRKTAAKSRGK